MNNGILRLQAAERIATPSLLFSRAKPGNILNHISGKLKLNMARNISEFVYTSARAVDEGVSVEVTAELAIVRHPEALEELLEALTKLKQTSYPDEAVKEVLHAFIKYEDIVEGPIRSFKSTAQIAIANAKDAWKASERTATIAIDPDREPSEEEVTFYRDRGNCYGEPLQELADLVLKMGSAALWFPQKGDPIRVRDMGDTHVENSIKYLQRKPDFKDNPLWKAYVNVLAHEQAYRSESNDPMNPDNGGCPRAETYLLKGGVSEVLKVLGRVETKLNEISGRSERRDAQEEELLKRAYDGLDDQGGR